MKTTGRCPKCGSADLLALCYMICFLKEEAARANMGDLGPGEEGSL